MILSGPSQAVIRESSKWTMSTSDIIQVLILAAIAFTCFLTYQSIRQQQRFNRIALRPWIYLKPDCIIEIRNGFYMLFCYIKNIGKIPAFNYKYVFRVANNDIFPSKEIKQALKKSTSESGVIFPNPEELKSWSIFRKGFEGKPLPNSPNEIKNILANSKLFLHTYVEYSYDSNICAFQATFELSRKWVTDSGKQMKYEYDIVHSSLRRIK